MTEPSPFFVPAGADRLGEQRGMGYNTVTFKVLPTDSTGILIVEIVVHSPGGPPLHRHFDQDEWFYVVQGEFVLEEAGQRFTLRPGDSLLAPRQVPHVWALGGAGAGRLIIVFNPAGRMEAFFREVGQSYDLPPLEPELWRSYGMELLGPPLNLA